MAKIIIENAVVERVFQDGCGLAVYETYTVQGSTEEKRKRFTAWFKESPRLEVGQVVSISGFVTAKVREFNDRETGEPVRVADIIVNGSRLIASAPPIERAPVEQPPEDPWAAPSDPVW